MAETSFLEMLELAKRLATSARSISLERFGTPLVTRRKPDNSVVTQIDDTIQAHIIEAIRTEYPDHAIIAEETFKPPAALVHPVQARFCWVIDPLDGTRNYASGFPCFATSIGVLDRGTPVAGVVLEHVSGVVYAAEKGGGAYCNGKPIRASDPSPGDDFLLGIPGSKDSLTIKILQSWVATPGFVCRNVGSTALHLAMVAAGKLSGAFNKQCKIWDVAAGALLITEAGGRFTGMFGEERIPFALDADPNLDLPYVAAGGSLHGQLVNSIETAIL